jgi:hypothetical protein
MVQAGDLKMTLTVPELITLRILLRQACRRIEDAQGILLPLSRCPEETRALRSLKTVSQLLDDEILKFERQLARAGRGES